MSDPSNPCVFVMGPTAAGKTRLAIELVQRLSAQIISVDSAMVYRRLDIGSGKPTASELQAAPHRLIDIREPHETFSAADFMDLAQQEIANLRGPNELPLLVGGTGLYFRALEEGLSKLPQANASVRAAIAATARAEGWPALHAKLAEHDPVRAAQLHPNDAQRIQRALEILELSGQPASSLERQREGGLSGPVLKIVVAPGERSQLHGAIAARFDGMLAAGFVDEVAALRADDRLSVATPSMRAVGYRQVWEHLDGAYDLATLREKGIVATRRLARRQLTWLRGIEGALWIDPGQENALSCVLDAIDGFMCAKR
ncbi:MAG: tRNA (adenosine(37)-N6)-dimethylallyltransferase MiaA [Gammaproteobacteria bacterium]|nr:tRNA (adenosine(37)-N6)-dimethylallyltransferase MiaA [Gammaproteobacteria bacterium]